MRFTRSPRTAVPCFTERTNYVILRAGDRRVASRVCAVFEVAETGLIIAWREYWDTADISRQMSVDVAGVLAAAVGDEQAIA
ncbi:limonene-1,2-epoxide hydrolase family protein [Sphingomonas solaris]|uniref:limonene-1,2-epoxide hydrolase family protein n=1 Tax=Alterirhizorhabdus solaris TaxID=2529389 RepID=UPI003B832D00